MLTDMLRACLFTIALASSATAQTYVGSDACTDCHDQEVADWAGSHHDLAWTEATPDTIVADFDGTTFDHDGMSVEFRHEGDLFFAKVTEKDGVTTDHQIHSVAGIEPLQQYLIETEPGRLQSFDVVWDTEQNRWYHLYPDQDLPPADGLHWTGPYKNWNARCAECHATGYKRNFGPSTKTYASAQVEIGVGCEACHGPGSAHLDWATGKELDLKGVDEYGLTMTFGADTEADIQQCAGCHSRREALADGNPLPGTPYHDNYTLAQLRPGLYHPDGQILDEVYVYGSFLQSRMYAQGVGCMNCHDPHTARVKADDNSLCTQCHSPAGNSDFPTLRLAEYDTPDHHNHPDGSTGAQCKSCHMIQRDYMGVDGRRDHSFRIPRPDLTPITGSPNTCNDCHADQTAEWAAEQVEHWFPDSDRRGPHFSEVFATAQTQPGQVAGKLEDIALSSDQPGLIRATALFLMQPLVSPELADRLAPLLRHDDPLVRGAAAVMQRGAPPEIRAARLLPVLADPMQSVRIAAAKQMIDMPPSRMTPSQRAASGQALSDWQKSLGSRLDFPETHLVLGGMALTLRNPQAAQRAFREVVDMDPQRMEAWSVLIRLTYQSDGPKAALDLVNEALVVLPDQPELLQMKAQLGG